MNSVAQPRSNTFLEDYFSNKLSLRKRFQVKSKSVSKLTISPWSPLEGIEFVLWKEKRNNHTSNRPPLRMNSARIFDRRGVQSDLVLCCRRLWAVSRRGSCVNVFVALLSLFACQFRSLSNNELSSGSWRRNCTSERLSMSIISTLSESSLAFGIFVGMWDGRMCANARCSSSWM